MEGIKIKTLNEKTEIVVTGANGFVGSNFVKKINSLDYIGIDKEIQYSKNNQNLKKIDLTDDEKVKELFEKISPKIIYHFAALISPKINQENPELAKKSHIDITKNLLENIDDKTHFIFLSTDKVYDGKNEMPDEKSQAKPLWIYGKYKLECEKMIKKKTQRYHIFRLPILHSVGDKKSASFIDKTIIDIKQGKQVNVYNNVYRCYVLLSDLLEILFRAKDNENYGIYNIGTRMMSYYDRIKSICEQNNIRYKSLLDSVEGKAEPMIQNLDTKKFQDLFSYQLK